MKKLTKFLFLCLVLLVQLSGYSQEKKNECPVLLNQKPYIFKYRQGAMDLDSVKQDYAILQECGKLDSIDGIIFQGPILAQLLIADRQEFNIDITYQVLIDLISEFKSTKEQQYQILRKGTIAQLEVENMPVDLNNFEDVRPKLIASGLSNNEVEKFKSFLETHPKSWNYKQAIMSFIQLQKSSTHTNQPLDFPKLETLEKLLADAKATNKNCLVYFSGYGCVNAKKLDIQALTNPEIQQLIQEHFTYAVAYVDDRQKDVGQNETNGVRYSKIQKQKFNSESQPFLYILSPDGKIIASWSYTDGINSFKSFLEQGIK